MPQKCWICKGIRITRTVWVGRRKLSRCRCWLMLIRTHFWPCRNISVSPVGGCWLIRIVIVRVWYCVVGDPADRRHGGVVRIIVGRITMFCPCSYSRGLPGTSTTTATRGTVRAVHWSLD